MNNPQLAPEGVEAAAEALRKMYHGGDPDEPFHLMAKCAIAAYLGSTGAVAPEPVAWRWRWASDDYWRAFGDMSTEASRADFIRNQEKFAPIVVEPLYTHPAPADTGQGGRVEEDEGRIQILEQSETMDGAYALTLGLDGADTVVLVRFPDPAKAAHEAAVEERAKAFYDLMPYDGPAGTKKPRWVEGGNSDKQQEARKLARAALNAGART